MRSPPKPRRRVWLALVLAALGGGLGIAGAFSPRPPLAVQSLPAHGDAAFEPALASLTNGLATTGRVTGVWELPEDYFEARLELVRRARKVVRFETFFLTPGRRADAFLAALAERARAGVRVQVLVDAAGCSLPASAWDALRAAGGEVRVYQPFDWRAPWRYNSRTHRKILVADHRVAMTGGAGVSDKWDGMPENGETRPWAELEFRLEGAVAAALEGVFMQHWAIAGGAVDLAAVRPAGMLAGDRPITVTAATPAREQSEIRLWLLAAIHAARRRLWLASPYFLPDASTRQALAVARQRGVDVQVLTEGPKNDDPYAYAAMRAQYGDLLAQGIGILEHRPSFMHAKALLVDEAWTFFGSANVDPRSLHLNDELALTLADPAAAAQVERFFLGGFSRSERETMESWRTRSWSERLFGRTMWLFRYQF